MCWKEESGPLNRRTRKFLTRSYHCCPAFDLERMTRACRRQDADIGQSSMWSRGTRPMKAALMSVPLCGEFRTTTVRSCRRMGDHHTPKWYLRRFSADEKRVVAFDRTTGKVFRANPAKVA